VTAGELNVWTSNIFPGPQSYLSLPAGNRLPVSNTSGHRRRSNAWPLSKPDSFGPAM
jgi:hypothetical protein